MAAVFSNSTLPLSFSAAFFGGFVFCGGFLLSILLAIVMFWMKQFYIPILKIIKYQLKKPPVRTKPNSHPLRLASFIKAATTRPHTLPSISNGEPEIYYSRKILERSSLRVEKDISKNRLQNKLRHTTKDAFPALSLDVELADPVSASLPSDAMWF